MGQYSVTVDDVVWAAAVAKARTEDTTADALVTAALMAYTGACEVMGIMIVPDPRMPAGVMALASPGSAPAVMGPADPLVVAGQPWSRPDATVLADLRQVERDDRERTSRPSG